MTDDGYVLPRARSVRPGTQRAAVPNGVSPTRPPASRSSSLSKSAGTAASRAPSAPPLAATVPSTRSSSAAAPAEHNHKVFVVYGQDKEPVDVVKQFLLFCGLHAMEWSEAVAKAIDDTARSTPTTYDIVKAGMASAAAIVVIFSPDELAQLDPRLAGGKPTTVEGQPRQNVLIEAGMAFATAPERTILVQAGQTRAISDIDGFNYVKLDGEFDSRQDFVNRLRKAGADLRPGPNLLDTHAGTFSYSP